jgi:hypothetical protein
MTRANGFRKSGRAAEKDGRERAPVTGPLGESPAFRSHRRAEAGGDTSIYARAGCCVSCRVGAIVACIRLATSDSSNATAAAEGGSAAGGAR